jgi:hypothetical protein
MSSSPKELPVIGWREWVNLPDLGVDTIKAKIDTGARSSALHAFDLQHFERDGVAMVRFQAHPMQRDDRHVIAVEAALLDQRVVRSSVGHEQLRPVIETSVQVGDQVWPIELTLTRRDAMGFRLLLGRQALRHRFWVDPGQSYLHPLTDRPSINIQA